ncbi:MAG: hypothetical protein ABEH43_07255, partial [Flavobacteriales bacterium]
MNGHYQDNLFGKYILGADKGGKEYWCTMKERNNMTIEPSFVKAAGNFFCETHNNAIPYYIDGAFKLSLKQSG